MRRQQAAIRVFLNKNLCQGRCQNLRLHSGHYRSSSCTCGFKAAKFVSQMLVLHSADYWFELSTWTVDSAGTIDYRPVSSNASTFFRTAIQFNKAIMRVTPRTRTSTLPTRLSTTTQKPIPMTAKSGPKGKRNFANPGFFHRKVGSAPQVSA